MFMQSIVIVVYVNMVVLDEKLGLVVMVLVFGIMQSGFSWRLVLLIFVYEYLRDGESFKIFIWDYLQYGCSIIIVILWFL